ncbi:hypothetical protein TWF506_009197 [Arthrobotrys conoides]|uniref:Uncharacterized protein n=1 Tax=Arthrobotrys conoides TaxID=74498 RepID=A0AAN8N8C1_9PEZI
MLIFIISILFFLPILNAIPVLWIPCEANPLAIDSDWRASPSQLTDNLQSVLTLLSQKDALRDVFDRLHPARIRADYEKIRRWERGRGLQHPYPMDSLREFYWFVSANKLHCHPNPLSLARAFSQIVQIESEPWGFSAPVAPVNNSGGINNNRAEVRNQPGQQQDPRYFGGVGEADRDHSSEEEADPTFQYFTYGPVKQLSILVHLHADELEQYFDHIVASGQVEIEPMLYFEIRDLIKDWAKLYYDIDAFMNGVRAFRKSLWMLRDREAKPKEIKILAEGKEISKPISIGKKLISCLDRFCNFSSDGRPRARPHLNN